MTRKPVGRFGVGIALIALACVVVACGPPPRSGGGTTTTTFATEPAPPEISTFAVRSTIGPAPAVVALTWAISDPNGDTLTCRIDGDGDGTAEIEITDCSESGSHNVTVTSPGPVTATLSVEDPAGPPVSATVSFSVAAGPTEPYDVQLRGLEDLDPDVAGTFTDAVDRWEQVIVRGVADYSIAPTPACLPAGSDPLPSVIDDVIIDVSVVDIDGDGGILGQAGPTCLNLANGMALTGVMEFDTDDVATLLADDALDAVILHEMTHVLGFGTLWDLTSIGGGRKVIAGAGTSSVRFTGARAIAEYSTLGKLGNVPIENTGGPGTADSHWREAVFANELMTGWLDSGSTPMSRLTIASMADLGFQVDLSAADAFSLPAPMVGVRWPRPEIGTVSRPPLAPA